MTETNAARCKVFRFGQIPGGYIWPEQLVMNEDRYPIYLGGHMPDEAFRGERIGYVSDFETDLVYNGIGEVMYGTMTGLVKVKYGSPLDYIYEAQATQEFDEKWDIFSYTVNYFVAALNPGHPRE